MIIGRQSDDKFLNGSTGEMLSVVNPQTVNEGFISTVIKCDPFVLSLKI